MEYTVCVNIAAWSINKSTEHTFTFYTYRILGRFCICNFLPITRYIECEHHVVGIQISRSGVNIFASYLPPCFDKKNFNYTTKQLIKISYKSELYYSELVFH